VAATIVLQLRLPRVLLALAGGAILALAGLSFQTLFRNPLAEPYTLGVASGAALGVAVAFTLGAGVLPGLPTAALAAFLGAGAAAVVVMVLGTRRGGATPDLLLAGVAVALFCQALILFLQYLSGVTETLRMIRWTMGGLGVVGYREVLWLLPWAAGGALLLLGRRWELDLLLTGDELAASRGVDLRRLRLVLLAGASLMVGALVAVTGPIGFVGLMVPHMLRRLVGEEHVILVPACLLGGGAFLALCDLVARTVLAPAELPVGILTALLGGPFFLWLLSRRAWRSL
jgi:iron complex transport system permease protein